MGSFVRQFVETWYFEFVAWVIILANALWLGLDTEYNARHLYEDRPGIFPQISMFFCIVFTFELAFRICAQGKHYFIERSWRTNVFDIFIVALQWVYILVTALGKDHFSSYYLRFLRLFSFFRIVRIMHTKSELRLLFNMIGGSLHSLCALLAIMFLSTFFFGNVLTQISTEFCRRNPNEEEATEELQRYYGSLAQSMLSLYESMTDGIHWHEVMEPMVTYCSPWVKLMFSAYMGFTMLALMNILSGFFMESAMQVAEDEQKK